jgi:hypothetical protein
MSKDHLFKPGQSGNPNGRPKDKTPATQIRMAIEARRVDILQAVIDAAIGGDMQACKMLLDRITPTLKPIAQPVTVPIDGDNTLAGQAAKVVSATLSGQIPPDIGSQLITALTGQSRIIEMQEMAERLERIEQQLEQRK